MKNVKVLLLTIVMFFGLWASSECADAYTPKEAISSTVDAILDILKDENYLVPERKEERKEKIRTLINDRFDFKEMSRRSLARHWNDITPAERKEFVGIFADLLVASYIGKIDNYTDEKVTYDKEVIKGKGNYGVVSTTIVTKEVTIPIEYKVILKDEKWWIYDVIVEGVSFISTYRSQYNKIIIKESYAKLMEKMKKKLDEVNTM